MKKLIKFLKLMEAILIVLGFFALGAVVVALCVVSKGLVMVAFLFFLAVYIVYNLRKRKTWKDS